jgi:hypothetical protein
MVMEGVSKSSQNKAGLNQINRTFDIAWVKAMLVPVACKRLTGIGLWDIGLIKRAMIAG